jgi:tetratricopeptide (TPR) repeat protein
MSFAAEMAKRGSWREALYRWERAAREKPGDPRILNNIAVAHEALGAPQIAFDYYERAMELARGDERVQANRIRFERFWSRVTELDGDDAPHGEATEHLAQAGAPAKGKGKAIRVSVLLPVPPRLDASGFRTVLVAKFLADQSSLIDVPGEMVRFVRSKLRKDPDLEILDVVPAPEVPEQTLEDLVTNSEFWKYLGREYGADLIVSGKVDYDRRDQSGFEEVDRIHPTTGQKVRTSEFVEQERFTYLVDLIFVNGATGQVVYQDRLQRSSVYRGSNNDPITAWYDLSESLAADLLAVVEPQTRQDERFIFRK